MKAMAAAFPAPAIRPSRQHAHAVGVRACRLRSPPSTTPPAAARRGVHTNAARCPRPRPHVALVGCVTPPCAPALATPHGCSAHAAPHPSLLAGDRQVLARGGCGN